MTPPVDSGSGWHRVRLDTVDSTNAYARRHRDELPDRTVITARRQTAGRGRFDRKWISSLPNNIYASLVLRLPQAQVRRCAAVMTHYLSLILCRSFEAWDLRPAIKWPNDVLVAGKKIAGILAEGIFTETDEASLILGWGVNLNLPPEALAQIDQPATAANVELGCPIDDDRFLENVLAQFADGYPAFLTDGFPRIRPAYLKRAQFLGQPIKLSLGETFCIGVAVDVDDEGALQVREDGGGEKKFHAGEMLTSPAGNELRSQHAPQL